MQQWLYARHTGLSVALREARPVCNEPSDLITWFGSLGFAIAHIGLEAGPLSSPSRRCQSRPIGKMRAALAN
jgi:hypothetical protein